MSNYSEVDQTKPIKAIQISGIEEKMKESPI